MSAAPLAPSGTAHVDGDELVVLLDDDGRPVGTRTKLEVHGADTPLHLAFSCHVVVDGGVVLTRRAAVKRTFPGVWTNAFCGHPLPGERLRDAVHRRARHELGLQVSDLRLVLPGFRYRAEAGGLVEHEWCPVLVARAASVDDLDLDPGEVDETAVVTWEELVRRAADDPSLSPWVREQVPLLAALGAEPDRWPEADPVRLPPALTW
ncbi:MAG: isopentenyl-diphosphate Delta-isomerase [Actinomycetota bacterium]|nr:isopentenyl-diphosphate Delta-isomerase [Actinomycetota bacterium]